VLYLGQLVNAKIKPITRVKKNQAPRTVKCRDSSPEVRSGKIMRFNKKGFLGKTLPHLFLLLILAQLICTAALTYDWNEFE